MKKIFLNIIIVIIVCIVSYFLSISFIFKVPSPTGISYHKITHQVGFYVSAVSTIITIIVLFVTNRKNKK